MADNDQKKDPQPHPPKETERAVDHHGAAVFSTAMRVVGNGVHSLEEAVDRDKAVQAENARRVAAQNAALEAERDRLRHEDELRRATEAERNRQVAQDLAALRAAQEARRTLYRRFWTVSALVFVAALAIGATYVTTKNAAATPTEKASVQLPAPAATSSAKTPEVKTLTIDDCTKKKRASEMWGCCKQIKNDEERGTCLAKLTACL